jgi:hypothetical protein
MTRPNARPARRIGDVIAAMLKDGQVPGLETREKRMAAARRIDLETRTKRNRQMSFDLQPKH